MKRNDITIKGWKDYELIDSGNGRKLENFGGVILDRPDPQAIWNKTNEKKWLEASAQFIWADKGERWKISKGASDSWTMEWSGIKVQLSLKGFKHVGIFPEHVNQWQEIIDVSSKNTNLKMLNLFGYTGMASLAALKSGIHITHVDASKSTIDILKENIKLSHLDPGGMRIICEDAAKYAKRLINRGEKFEIIVMDPPAFGRGPKGEVWKIEESLQSLVSLLPNLISPNAKMVILNGYAAGFAARTFAELLNEVLPDGNITYGDISIEQDEKNLTTGIYAKWRSNKS